MHNFRASKFPILLLLALLLGSLGIFAKPAAPDTGDAVGILMPTARQATLDRTIAELLSQHHYRQSRLDDRLSALILTTYLDDLDFSRSYFLAEDIASFERYRNTLDNSIKKGDLQPAYVIFNVYLQRLTQRTAQIQSLLKQNFRFDVDESLNVDRKDAPWAKTLVDSYHSDAVKKYIQDKYTGAVIPAW